MGLKVDTVIKLTFINANVAFIPNSLLLQMLPSFSGLVDMKLWPCSVVSITLSDSGILWPKMAL